MTALMCWLDEIDEALVGSDSSADAERRLEALIDQGVTLLAVEAPLDTAAIDATVIDRVQGRLRAIADEVAAELDSVRQSRRELTRAGRAHAGYRAVAAP